MRSLSFVGPVPASRSHQTLSAKKSVSLQLLMCVMAFVTVLFSAGSMNAQTLALSPAVTDLYSNGFVNFASTQVAQSTSQTIQLRVTGGALTITSISVPTSTTRTQQFKVGTITGCTLGASNATNTVCSVPITFTPAYTGYQTSPLIAVTSNGTFRFGLNGFAAGPQAVLMPGVLTTFAGNGTVGATALQYKGDGGAATSAQVFSHSFTFDSLGDMYEAEYDASVVREINTAGVINTVAGTFATNAGTGVETATQCATPTVAPFPTCVTNGANSLALNQATLGNQVSDVAFDSAGNLYIADTIEDRVRRVDAVTGIISTIAGTGAISETGDGGLATAATLNVPEGVMIDNQDNIYILDSNAAATANGAVVRFVNHATGNISTIAGTAGAACAAGGAACGDGGPATSATLGISAAFYVDQTTGHFWIADRDANRIRFVNFNYTAPATVGTISTVAGNGTAGFAGDGGAATTAELNGPHGIWVDPAGDIYISDRNNNRVRFVSAATGNISTLAGGGGTCTPTGLGSCGDGGPANGPNANLTPNDLALDVNGNLFVTDQANNAIREIVVNPTTLTFTTVPVGTTSGPLTATLLNIGTLPLVFTDPSTTGVSNALVTTTGPTAAASNAYTQTAATTCGPVFSTTAATSVAAGATCNYVVAFTPDTTAGNYKGTLVETDNSAVSTTQTISLVGAATAGTVTIGVTSSVNPSTYGQNVTFTATVSGGGIAPTGTVTFTYTPTGSTTPVTLGTGTLSTTGSTTTATLSTTVLPVGVDNIVATYGGDANYTAGTASTPLPQTVNIAPITNDTITATPNPTTSGQTVTLTFTVPDGATAPAATTAVTFTTVINGTTTTLGTAAVKGVTAGGSTTYTTTTTALPVGTDTITGTFTGDTNYASGALTTTETVNQAGSTGDTVVVATNPTVVESADTITFSIPVVAGTAVPAGSVVFTSGTTNLGTATFTAAPTPVTCPAGTCYTVSISTTALPLTVAPATSTPVTATFTATAASGYASATPTTTVVVNQVSGTNDAVTAANATTTVGTADALTYSIPAVTGAPVPAGTVAFTSGATSLGSATWPATPTTGTCPGGAGTCYLLADAPSPTNIPLTTAPATSTPITATFTAAAASGYASAAPTTTVVVSAAGGSGDTLTVANNPTTFGTADPLTFSIPVSSGAPAPAGTVVFTAGTTALGTATWPANPVASGGFYTISVSPTNIPVGAPTKVTATFTATAASGYGSAAPFTNVTVNQVPLSNDGISANPSATTSGSTVTLTFTVPNVNSTPPASTATVTFTYNGTTLGTANLVGTTAAGVTTYTTTTNTLPVGTDTVTGTFVGDTNYAGGALTTPVAISQTNSVDLVTVGTNPTTVGSSDTITFSIPVTGGAAVPTGSVVFTSGSTNLGTATFTAAPTPVACASGTCYTVSITTTALPLTVAPSASTPVLATFTAGGTSGYASATATTTVVVNQVSGVSDAVTAASGTIAVGTADSLTFSIPVVTGAPVPTGTVVFTSGSTALGSATWPATPTTGACPGGAGTCYLLADAPSPSNIPLTVAPATSTPITATYTAGSGSGYASSAPTTSVVVNAASGAGDTLTVTNNPTTYGTADPLTFSIPVTSGAPAPAGTVTFTAGGTALGAATWPANPTPVGGFYTISVSPTNIPVGSPTTVTATFAPTGASGYGAAAPTATVVVNKVPITNDGIAANPSATTSGSTVTLTFTVPNVNSTPSTGTVTFTYNGTTLGTANLTGTTAGGVTTYTTTTTTLPVGTDTVTGTFSGDGDYAGGALTTPVAISSATTTDTVSVGTNPTTVGSSDTITFSIPVTGGAAVPTGTVAFTSGSTNLGSATWPAAPTVAGGFYTLQITTTALPLTVAPSTSTPVLATFTAGGTSGYASATATTTVVVNQVSGAGDAVTAANGTTTVGTADPLTFSIPVATGAPVPTGTVVFSSGTTALGSATWPATPVTGACPSGVGTCYLLADTPPPSNIPLTVAPATSTPITATYTAGSGSGYASSAPTTSVDVTPVGGTGGTLTIANNPTTYGTADPMTFSLPVGNGVPAPSGTVVFTAGGVTLGTATWPAAPTAVGGFYSLTINPTNTPVGSPTTVTATFTPTAGSGYGASAPTATVTVNKAPLSSDSIAASPNPQAFNSPVTLVFTVPTVNGTAPAAASTVTFTTTIGGTLTTLGTGAVTGVTAGGVTTYTTTTSVLPPGADTITGTFTGDGNYAGGPLTTVETINPTTSGATLAAGPNPATFGTPVTLTETITPIAGTCPAGPTTFYNNGTVIGTGTVSLTGGSCVATLTTSTLPVGTDSITATVPASGGFVATTSGPVALVINKANAADVLTSSPNPSVFGTPVVITDTIPIAVTGVPPTGTVNFYDFTTLIGTGTVNAQGVATITTSTLPVGTDSLTGVYQGDANYAQVTTAPVNQVVTAVSTTATLAVGPNPTNFGMTVTMTETIPVTNGTPATGVVTFFSNGTQIGTGTLANGVATITSSTLPVGTDQITATYNGDTNYSSVKSGPVAEVVNTANGADTLNVNPDPAVFGTPVTITDTIPTVGGVAPTGTVTFYDNGTSIGTGTVNASGVATLTTTTLPVGSDPITASYGGDPNYAPVTTGPVNEIITVGNTTPVLGATPNPTTFGTTVTLTESIPGINGIAPTGTVTFSDNGTAIGTANVVNGVATLTTSTLPIGTDPITAAYSGDSTYAKANSGPLNVVINKAAPTDTLTANPNPSTFGSPVTLTFTVPPVNGVPPTGTVSFYNGTTLLGTATVNAQGIATLTTSQLPFGTDTVTATYPGDNNYAPANPSTTITVSPIAPTSVLTGPTTPPACGSSVTLTDTITGVNGVALGGTVQFFDNGVAIGSPIPVPANGVVTLTTTSLPCTADVITAVYTPPANSPYLPSTGGPITVNISTPDFSIAGTPSNQTINPGDGTTYTVSLSGVGAPFTSPVTLTATCNCQGVTITFANPTVTPGAGPTTTTMTVTTAPNFASVKKPSGGANGIYYGLLLLPLLGVGRIRRKLRTVPKGISFCLAALLLLGGLGAMTGCGGGYYGPAPTTCTITVTGTSGSLSHSTTVTLTVR